MNVTWNRWTKGGFVLTLIVGVVLAGGLVWSMATGHWRSFSHELDVYERGVLEGDEAAVAEHICSSARSEMLSLDGGFDEAREQTFEALPGQIEKIGRRRGADDHAVLPLHIVSRDTVLYDLPVIWVEDGEPKLCPSTSTRLLGSPR